MQCQQCGRPLANPTAICTACDQELSTPSHLDVGTPIGEGRYRCPACSGSFDRWTTSLLPRNARWYTPQYDVPTCPLCKEALQWKRDPEPAQLPSGLQGIAIGMTWALYVTIPTPLLQWIKEHMGKWFAILLPLLLLAMFVIAVRPTVQSPRRGTGRFVLAQPQPFQKHKFWALSIIGVAIMASIRTAPQATQLPLWCAWLGLAAAGCIAAVVWRRSVERHQRLRTPDPTAPYPTRLP